MFEFYWFGYRPSWVRVCLTNGLTFSGNVKNDIRQHVNTSKCGKIEQEMMKQ